MFTDKNISILAHHILQYLTLISFSIWNHIDTDSVSHHSIHDTTAARHRAQDDESTHTASLHSPALSLRTPTKASAVPRAAASYRDQQPQKEQSLPVSATSIISEQRNLLRNESAPASFKSVHPGNLSSKSFSSESRELRSINPNELVYLDGRHNNEISRFPEDAPISHRSSSSISSIATDSMILPSQSGKPMRRQHAPQEAKHVKEKVDSYFAHDPCSSRSTRTIDRTDEYNWVSGAVTFQNRKDRDQTAMPSVDLPSPNMSATDVKPTLMIPYQTLRHLSTSVESNASSIDTSHKENNLYEDEFEQIFQMTRDQWNALPTWQQARKKKQVGLF